MMNKYVIGAISAVLLAATAGSGPALASARANTSQKGSLLIWPLINVDSEDTTNTLIEISNDNIAPVHIKCWYVNEKKARVDFDFDLTAKQTLSWEVLTGTGDIAAPLFPIGGTFPVGNERRGELICFATDAGAQNQIAWNHLTGTATVAILADTDATQTKQAYRYNAWAFMAKGSAIGVPAPEGSPHGKPGDLQLTGAFDGSSYDACPVYNIANFMPNGATLNGVKTLDNDLVVVSCNQDLRQDFLLHTTKAHFTVWNAHENSFTGSYICIDSVASIPTGGGDRSTALVNGTNFDFSTLQTDNARFQVQGIASSVCDPKIFGTTEDAGLLGVLTSSVSLGGDSDESQEIASTTHVAGMQAGFILWDPHGPPLATPKKR